MSPYNTRGDMDLCLQHTLLQVLRTRDTFHQYSHLHDKLEIIITAGRAQGQKSPGTPVRYCSRNLHSPASQNTTRLQHVSLELELPSGDYKTVEKLAFPRTGSRTLEVYDLGWEDAVVLQLPNSEVELHSIIAYADSLPNYHFIGYKDRRPHALDVLNFCYPLK